MSRRPHQSDPDALAARHDFSISHGERIIAERSRRHLVLSVEEAVLADVLGRTWINGRKFQQTLGQAISVGDVISLVPLSSNAVTR